MSRLHVQFFASPFFQHECVLITDSDPSDAGKTYFLIDYPSERTGYYANTDSPKDLVKDCTLSTQFYAEGNLDKLSKAFFQRFKANEYDRLTKNCASASQFVLDYLLPKKPAVIKALTSTGQFMQCTCCLGFNGIAALGLLAQPTNSAPLACTAILSLACMTSMGGGCGIPLILRNTPLNVHTQACIACSCLWKTSTKNTPSISDDEAESDYDEESEASTSEVTPLMPSINGPTQHKMS